MRATLLRLMVAVALPTGCPGGGEKPPQDLAPPDVGRPVEAGVPPDLRRAVEAAPAADELVVQICSALQRCQAELGPAFASSDDCLRHFSRLYACGRTPGEVNGTARQRCLAWLAQASCQEPPLRFGCVPHGTPLACGDPLSQWGRLGAPGCGQVFVVPALGQGASCESGTCDEGLYCKRGATGAICPVCRTAAAAGASCLESPLSPAHLPCSPGLACAGGSCVARLATGKSCQKDSQCASGFCRSATCAVPLGTGEAADLLALDQCAGFRVVREKVCAVRRPAGQACSTDVDCLLDAVCVGGLCQRREVCAARQPGEPCVTEPLGCVASAFCNNTGEPQRCEARRPLGEPCEFTDDCQDGAYCSLAERHCTAYAGAGGSCAGALLCAKDLYCEELTADSVCTPKRAEGASCGYGFQCVSTTCASGSCVKKPPCTMP